MNFLFTFRTVLWLVACSAVAMWWCLRPPWSIYDISYAKQRLADPYHFVVFEDLVAQSSRWNWLFSGALRIAAVVVLLFAGPWLIRRSKSLLCGPAAEPLER
jgi:hypothetical protein